MNPVHITQQLAESLRQLGYRDRGPHSGASAIGPGRLLLAPSTSTHVHLTGDPDTGALHVRFAGVEREVPWSLQTEGPVPDYAAVLRGAAAVRTARSARSPLEIAGSEYGWKRQTSGVKGLALWQRPDSSDVLLLERVPAGSYPFWQALLPDARPCGVREIHGRGPVPANLLRAMVFESTESESFPGTPESPAGKRLSALGFTVARHQVTGALDYHGFTYLADLYRYADHERSQLITVHLSRFPENPGTFAEIGAYPVGANVQALLSSQRTAYATSAPIELPADALTEAIEQEARRIANL